MGAVYDIEIYFQGDDNLIKSADFLESSKDPRAWTVSHPMYGSLFVQPLSLKYDDTKLNATKIIGQWMETIGNDKVITNISPIDVIPAQKLDTDFISAQSFAVEVPAPLAADVAAMKGNVTLAERLQVAFATTTEDANLIINTYNEVNAAIDEAFTDSFRAVAGIQRLLSLPVVLANTIIKRMQFIERQLNALYTSITSLHTPHLKKLYENNAGVCITSMCGTTVTNITPTDYPTRNDVVGVINIILDNYNNYIANLDTLQTATGGTPQSYVPDFESLNGLQNLVYFTISNLFDIAANAKQQRVTTLLADSNWIIIARDLYGLLADDSTITDIMAQNNVGLNEIMYVKKGREIIYYI